MKIIVWNIIPGMKVFHVRALSAIFLRHSVTPLLVMHNVKCAPYVRLWLSKSVSNRFFTSSIVSVSALIWQLQRALLAFWHGLFRQTKRAKSFFYQEGFGQGQDALSSDAVHARLSLTRARALRTEYGCVSTFFVKQDQKKTKSKLISKIQQMRSMKTTGQSASVFHFQSTTHRQNLTNRYPRTGVRMLICCFPLFTTIFFF